MTSVPHPITADRYGAVLFDLDGVLTSTARMHATCWKKMFDEFLRERAGATGAPFQPFVDRDYKLYVDGKPRYEGVQSFLQSRKIELPQGEPQDPPSFDSVCGLGNRKNELVHQAIEAGEVEVYESSVTLVRQLHGAGIKTAVVSSSRNCEAVLRAAGIEDFNRCILGFFAAAELAFGINRITFHPGKYCDFMSKNMISRRN